MLWGETPLWVKAREEYQASRYLPAFELASQAVTRDPRHPAAHFWRGLASARMAEKSGGLKALRYVRILEWEMREVLRLDPAYSEAGAHRVLGRTYLKLPWILGGGKQKSLKHLKNSVALAPRNALNHVYLAETQLELGNRGEAMQALQTALALLPQSENGEETGETERLVQELRRVLSP